jgi:hypothetical protein
LRRSDDELTRQKNPLNFVLTDRTHGKDSAAFNNLQWIFTPFKDRDFRSYLGITSAIHKKIFKIRPSLIQSLALTLIAGQSNFEVKDNQK